MSKVIVEKCLEALEYEKNNNMRNRMGCSETWYNPYYAIGMTFSEEELNEMSANELQNLVRLAETLAEALY